MKKTIVLTALLLSSNGWAMTGFPTGNFQGKGHAVSPEGKESVYQVEARVSKERIESTYSFEGGTRKFTLDTRFAKNGYFDVLQGAAKIGSGYCMSIWCHYNIKMGENTVEETFVFQKNHLYRLGQKLIDGKLISWEEDLEQE